MLPFSSLLLFTSLLTTVLAAANVSSSSYVVNGDDGASFTIAVNVPSTNQDDDLYFHVSSPSLESWIGFGFGSRMLGSLVFVMYGSADGNNVTVSPRIAPNHQMPIYTPNVKVEVLAGSGLINGNYIVNAKCTGCRSWAGGNIDITSTAQPMIWAVLDGPITNSNNLQETIVQHTDYGTFSLNLIQATGEGGVPSGSAGGSTAGETEQEDPVIARRIHGGLMILCFLVLFPLGYLLLRVFERVWIHWTIQSVATFFVVIAMAGGVALSKRQSISPNLNAPHQIIGFVTVFLVLSAWTLGLIGHRLFRKHGVPAVPMRIHRFVGPGAIFLGLVNCASGFHFAGENGAIIGLAIMVALMILIVGGVLLCTRRRRARRNAMNTPAAVNFRQGQMEGGGAMGPQEEGVLLQPYGAGAGVGGERPVAYSMPSYHSEGGYSEGGQGQVPAGRI